ncbi:MAG: amidohydrolase, partial [Bacteroidetes bacterium]
NNSERPADLLLINGQIYTQDDALQQVEALAISDGKIVAAGSSRELMAWQGDSTKILDLTQRVVLPGFTDSHIHPISAGLRILSCDLSELRDETAILQTIREYARTHPENDWIKGGGLWLPAVGGGNPSRYLLDSLVADRPVYLTSTDGHSAWVNSKALELAQINADTKDPTGGVIERQPDGEPSGVLREYAMRLVSRLIPPQSFTEKVQALELAMHEAHRVGVTAWIDAAVDEESIKAYLELERQGKLKLDVSLSLLTEIIKGMDAVAEVEALYQRYQAQAQRINMHSTKILIDGVIEGKTAALFDNYTGEDFRGEPYIDAELYQQMIAAYDSLGFQVHVHACGDRAVSMTLDAFEYAQAQHGKSDHRHHIVHLQLMKEKDIPRFAELDLTANLQTLWATPEDTYISELTIPVLGPQRSEWIYPFGAIARTGARIACGSDWPVTSVNPFPALQVAVSRRGPDSLKRTPWTPQHLLSRQAVVSGYTIGGAYLMNQDTHRGRLCPGMDASLIVLDQDVFHLPTNHLYQIKPVLTLWRGEPVFSAID